MKKVLFILIILIFAGVFLYSGYRIISKMGEYKEIEDAYDDIANLVVRTIPTSAEDDEEIMTTYTESEPSIEEEVEMKEEVSPISPSPYDNVTAPIQVDFETLCAINPDIVGWIYCEGTTINYPVLQGESNDTYLYHRYDGTYSFGGSIFMDYRCARDFSDDYTVIYGHNMLADSMFNSLDYFRKQEYLDKHSRFFYLTPSGKNYCLEVICVNLTVYKDDLRLFELRDDELNLDLIRSQAEADTGLEVSDDDQFVLLATCTYDFKDAKCTVLCKAIELGA